MARIVDDREDLLRDARNLTPRVQLRVRLDGCDAAVFAGFRGESLSLYFGPAPAYHFNASGELRRAFVGDRMVKAEGGLLVGMVRVATPEQIQLQSAPFSGDEQERFLAELADRLAHLERALSDGDFDIEGQSPPDGDAVVRLTSWLARHRAPRVGAAPNVD